MSNICIVSVSAPKNMVMLNMYTTYLFANHIDFDLIYLDKYHVVDNIGAKNTYRIEYGRKNKFEIIKGYLSFKKQTESLLKRNNYRFVIVWSELTAAILSRFLESNYRGKYCVNVRDLFEGKRKIFSYLLNIAIRYSAFTTVSSEKYISKLTSKCEKYLFVHSFNDKIMNELKGIEKKKAKDAKINILYIGNIRFYNHLYYLMDTLVNDDRFTITVAGHGSEQVKKYAKEIGMHNISVFGGFPKEKTADFLASADIIYNLYGTDNYNLRTALSNKLYYACCMKVPILVYRNTYMYELANMCGIGFAIDDFDKNELGDALFDWYNGLDMQYINNRCDAFIEKAKQSQLELYGVLDKHIKFDK